MKLSIQFTLNVKDYLKANKMKYLLTKLFNKQKREINRLTDFIVLIQINSLSFKHKKKKRTFFF